MDASVPATRSATPEDAPEATRLFADVFGRPQSVAQYRWKLFGHGAPFPTAYVAVVDDRIVGQYACTPFRMRMGTRTVLAAHGCDVMTAPGFRRRGILSRLGHTAHAAWTGDGLAFLTGLHYADALGWGSRRSLLGWRPLVVLRWMRRLLRPARLLARRVPAPRSVAGALDRSVRAADRWWDRRGRDEGGVSIVELERADARLDRLWHETSPAYDCLVVRDAAWIHYRYLEAPHRTYRLLLAERNGLPVGYVVFAATSDAGRTTGWLADFLARPDEAAARALIRAAVTALRDADADEVRVLLSPETWLARALGRQGFFTALGPYDASVAPLASPDAADALGSPGRWFTMGGDFDVV